MSESLHWVMASSQVTGVDDGSGRLLTFVVDNGDVSARVSGWRWSAVAFPTNGPDSGWLASRGEGYPDPNSARKAAEYWLSVTREQNALVAAQASGVLS